MSPAQRYIAVEANGKAKVIIILATTLWTLLAGVGVWEIKARTNADEESMKDRRANREAIVELRAQHEAQFEEIQRSLARIEKAIEAKKEAK